MSSSTVNFLEKAIEIVKDATEKDHHKNYEEAYKLYTASLEYFILALKYERNPQSKESIRKKVVEYLERAEYLKNNLNSPSGSDKSPAAHKEPASKTNTDEKHFQEAIYASIIEPDPNLRWDDVAGLEGAKEALKEAVILPTKFPHLFVGKRAPWRGILLYGPPGTGKSFLSRVVASEAKCTFFSVSSSDLVCKWMGESERIIRQLFAIARSRKPSIIFIDEIDSICGERSDSENDATRRIKTETLVQMQGISGSSDGLLVIGATNTPWSLDPAVRRRFEKRIYIPMPDYNARLAMFKANLKGSDAKVTLNELKELSKKTEGYTGSDIGVIVRDALMAPIRKMQFATCFKRIRVPSKDNPSILVDMWQPCSPGEKGAVEKTWNELDPKLIKEPDITISDLVSACANTRPSSNMEYIHKYKEWADQYGTE